MAWVVLQLVGYVTELPGEEKGVNGLRVFMRLKVLHIADEEKDTLFESKLHDVITRGEVAMYAAREIEKGMCILVEGSLEGVGQDGGGETYVLVESILKVVD